VNQIIQRLNIEEIVTQLAQFTPKLITAVSILFLFWLFFRITRGSLRLLLQRSTFEETLIRLLVDNTYRAILMIFALVMAADQVGINIGAALAGMGIAGVAFGFAAQDSLANTIAGVMILWDKPFQVGDWVTVANQYGQVREITMRTTRIRTHDNTYVIIPNKVVIDVVLVNHSKHGEARVCVPVGIAYKERIADARRVILEAVLKIDGVMQNPLPEVVVTALAASSVDMEVRVWIHEAADEIPVYNSVMETSKLALDAAGIEIPYHHLQLFVENVQDQVWAKAAALPNLAALAGGEGRPTTD